MRQLVVIANERPNDPNVLSDLTETYKWLSSECDRCQALLLSLQDEHLFLNVDDTSAAWRFSSAERILFNGYDEDNWQSARTFLFQFKALLLNVGAKEIKQVARPPLQLSPADQVLVKLRTALNKQRLEGHLTDIVLLSSDEASFTAHRAILAASSQHFERMFGHNWSEKTGPVRTQESSAVLSHALGMLMPGICTE